MTGCGRQLISLVVDDFMKDDILDFEIRKSSNYTLADIYDGDGYRGKVKISYEYDYGDNWDHQITFLGRAYPSMRKAMGIPNNMRVLCLGGEVSIASPLWGAPTGG